MYTIKYGVNWQSYEFHCTNCNCVFEADEEEYKITGPIEIEGKTVGYSLSAECPRCHHLVYEGIYSNEEKERRKKVKIYVANFQCTKCKARFYSTVYIGGEDRPTAYESQCPDCHQWNGTTELTEITDGKQISQLLADIGVERRNNRGC